MTSRVMPGHRVELGLHVLLSLPNGKTKCAVHLAAEALMV